MRAFSQLRLVLLMSVLFAARPSADASESLLAEARTDPPASAAALAGTWESVTRSHGGIGQIIELGQDGTVTRRVAAMVDFTYKLDGDRLVTSFTDPKTGKAQDTVNQIRFDGTSLVESAEGREIRLTRRRSGPPGDPPIVGVWSYPHEAGGTAFVMYTADGRMIFRLPIRSDRGTWNASPTQLTIASPGARTFRYQIDGGRLVLTDDQNKVQEYRRAELVDYP